MASVPCTYCQASAPLYFRVKDFNRKLSSEHFAYYHCPQCQLIFLHPHPADLGRYYPQEYYNTAYTIAELEKEYSFNRYKLDVIQPFVRSGRLLEVGPGRGTFAYLAKQAGYEVSVIERDAECCHFLRETASIKTYNDTNPTAALEQQSPYDIIALWQVIEHLGDPWDFIRVAATKLKPGGLLVLATPNPAAIQFKIFGSYWFHLDAPRHLQLIPASLLVQFGETLGLREVFLTSADADIDRHNVASWVMSAKNAYPFTLGRSFFSRCMAKLGRVLRAYEQAGFRSSTYTLVLQKSA